MYMMSEKVACKKHQPMYIWAYISTWAHVSILSNTSVWNGRKFRHAQFKIAIWRMRTLDREI